MLIVSIPAIMWDGVLTDPGSPDPSTDPAGHGRATDPATVALLEQLSGGLRGAVCPEMLDLWKKSCTTSRMVKTL